MSATSSNYVRKFRAVVAFGAAVIALLAGCGKSPVDTTTTGKQKKGAGTSVDTAAATTTTNAGDTLAIKSIFVVEPDQVPDPFFPKLKKQQQQQAGPGASTSGSPTATPVASAGPQLVVQQIIGSGARRVALINDQVFEPGRSASVTVPGGQRLKVFCIRVDAESVTVRVEGQGGGKEIELPAPRKRTR
jgi:hypothetical protein